MVNLSSREKHLLKGLIALLAVLLIYFVILTPIVDYKSEMEKKYQENIAKLGKLDNLYEKYLNIKRKKNEYHNLLRDNEGVSTLIETYAKETNILKNKVYTRDQPSNIQNKLKKISTSVKFEGVNMNSALEFIYKLENSNKKIRITYLRVHQALKGKDIYDVTMKITSYSLQ